MDSKTTQMYTKRFLYWVFGNTAWDVFRRILSLVFSIVSTWYFSNQTQFSKWLFEMNISNVVAIVGMLIGFFVIAFSVTSTAIRLGRNIIQKRSPDDTKDYVIYDGLTLEEDKDVLGFVKTANIGANLDSKFTLTVNVHNKSKHVYDGVVELENLEYQGKTTKGEWISGVFEFDRKAMRWDVGYEPHEGKVEIGIGARKKLEIAIAFQSGNMELSHLDGYSNHRYLLDGNYRVTLRIDGKVSVKEVKRAIKPRWYEVEFEFPSERRYLKLLAIKEYEPPKETT